MTAMALLLIVLAVLIGTLVPLQAGINATLAQHAGHPLFGMMANMTLATVIVYSLVIVLRVPLPFTQVIASAPWYAWIGGVCGVTLVFGAMTIAPRLGAAPYVCATLVGTILASLTVDHFGLLAFRPQPITLQRLLGAALVIIGTILVTVRRT